MKNKVLVMVPIYNESENIDYIINDLSKLTGCDIVFINDASEDNSLKLLYERNQLTINLPINLGIGGCIQTGYIYAYNQGYDIAVQYDGDGQHCASFVDALIFEINNGYDYVIGSRFATSEGEGFKSTKTRRIGIKILSWIIWALSGVRINDVTSGFRACNREVMELFTKYYAGDFPEPEVAGALAKTGYKIIEIPVKMRQRYKGKSSIKPLKSIYYMVKVATAILFSSFVYHKKGY